MGLNSPFMSEFWDNYQRFMKSTFENVQQMMGNMDQQMGPINAGPGVNTASAHPWSASSNPQVHVDEKNVTVAFQVDKIIDRSNTQVYLEGYYLVVDGAVKARVALPAAVCRYGGKAVYRQGSLEVTLPMDRFTSRQTIPIDIL